MKKRKLYYAKSIALLFACTATLFACMGGCKKPKNNVTGGGKGGNAVLRVIPEHAQLLIDSCIVYIRYNTKDAPADGLYDDSVKCVMEDTTPVATFSGLTVGNYYLLGVGYHTGYSPPDVRGGIPCQLSTENTTTVYLPTYSYIK